MAETPILPTADEVERAIAIVEDSRRTHVEWAEWQEATPNWQSQVEPTSPGEPAHHRRCISEYDEVLSVLRRVAPLAGTASVEHFAACSQTFCAGLVPRTNGSLEDPK